MKIKIFFFTLALLSFTANANCQTDTEFWFVAPEVSRNGSENLDRPIYLRMSSFDHSSDVTVTQPANPSFKEIKVSISANSSQTIDLTTYIDEIENKPPNQVLNYGIYIKASKPIQAYYEVASLETNYNPELFALKGKNALGTHFIIPGQTVFHNDQNYTPKPYFAYDIVAVNDSTSVIINPTKDLVGHSAGVPFKILLNKGQTYSAASIIGYVSLHPDGSEVLSDKPIAITLKDDLLNGLTGCADLVGDQLVPVNITGTEYNAVKGFLEKGEYIFITGTEDKTNVSAWSPNYSTYNINKGQVLGILLDNTNSCHIESDKPVYAYQISGIGCELGSALLPQIKCTGSRQVAFTRTTPQLLSLMIFTTSNAIGGFSINSDTNLIKSSDFASIPGTNGYWQYARLTFDTNEVPVSRTIIVSNDKDFFHLGVLEGNVRTGCSYGFFSDYNSLNLGDDLSICPGDSTELDAGYGKDPYLWSTGSTNRSIMVKDTGTYWVIARLGNCEVRDTIHISYVTMNVLSLGPDKYLCNIDRVLLSAGNGFKSYKWSTGDTTKDIYARMPGTYSVETVSPEGCIQKDTINVFQIDTNIKITNLSGTPCAGDTVTLVTTPGFDEYDWSLLPSGPFVITQKNSLKISKSGKYYVNAKTYSGCVATSDTIDVEFSDSKLTLSSNPPINNGIFNFGSVRRLGINCLSVDLTNNSTELYYLGNVSLKNNTEFSVPQSQFVLNFAPGETKELIICFSPDRFGELTDSLFISDSCISLTIGLLGNCVGDNLSGLSNCGISVLLSTGDSSLQYFEISEPNPNPAGNIVRCRFLYNSLKNNITTITGGLYDMLGTCVAITESSSLEINNKNTFYSIKGEFIFDTKDLPSGIYTVVAISDGLRAVRHLLILK